MSRGQTRTTLRAAVRKHWPDWSDTAVEDAISGGQILVDGRPLANPRAQILATSGLRFEPRRDLAGRRKLAWAIERFGVDVAGRVALDVGACTGGFTTAWLDAGASRVFAVDVGHGQLLGSLRQDPRVVNLERTNVADLSPFLISDAISLISIDVSYLSLTAAVEQLGALPLADGAELLGLVKPMFELRLPTIPTDPVTLADARTAAVAGVSAAGWRVVDADECPVRGQRGAVEFVVHARR